MAVQQAQEAKQGLFLGSGVRAPQAHAINSHRMVDAWDFRRHFRDSDLQGKSGWRGNTHTVPG